MDIDSALKYLSVKLKEEFDDFVVSSSLGEKTQVKFANNNVVTTKFWESQNIEIFASWKKRLVSTNVQDMRKEVIDKTIKQLYSFARKSDPNPEYYGIGKGPFRYSSFPLYDDRIANLENPFTYVKDAINSAQENGAERSAGVFEFSDGKYTLISSENVEASSKDTAVYLSLRCHSGKGSGYSNQVGRSLNEIDASLAGREAATTAVSSKDPQKIDAGNYDMIFSEYPFANLASHFGSSALISSVETQTSFITNMIGKEVSSRGIYIYDDPNIHNGLASRPFDDEGIPSRKTAIVEDGILKTYLHNTSTSIRHNSANTAHAGLISPENTNLIISGKEVSEKKLFKDFSGLHITNLWYIRFQNYLNGEFSSIPRDGIFLYKNGEIVKPVTEIRISDNMLRVFRNIESMSNNKLQQCGWEVEDPVFCGKALVKNVKITRPN